MEKEEIFINNVKMETNLKGMLLLLLNRPFFYKFIYTVINKWSVMCSCKKHASYEVECQRFTIVRYYCGYIIILIVT